MTEEELIAKYSKEYEYLTTKCIYELRTIAKQKGVCLPSVQRKRELILTILKISEGILPKKKRNRVNVPEEKAKENVLSEGNVQKPAETALLLTKEELETLSKFAYIGTRVSNYYHKAQDIDIGYYEFTDKIYAHCFAAENGLASAAEVKECERASVCNRMERELCADITFYENGVFKELLAELLTDKNYPLREGEDPSDHFNAEEIYMEKLEEQGLDFVSFVAPSIDAEVRACYIPDTTEAKHK